MIRPATDCVVNPVNVQAAGNSVRPGPVSSAHSVFIALFIGGIEGLQIISQESGATGGLWSITNRLDLQNMGFVIIATFVAARFVSVGIYRLRGYDRLDAEVSTVPIASTD